jgi:hypothetical protein
MTYGIGWPFSEMLNGYAHESQDDLDAEQDAREAREDRAADHAPAAVPFMRLNAEPLRVRADYVRDVVHGGVLR